MPYGLGGNDYIVYTDTDSMWIALEDVMQVLKPVYKDIQSDVDLVNKIMEQLEYFIEDIGKYLAKLMNLQTEYYNWYFKTEEICRTMICTGVQKRYAYVTLDGELTGKGFEFGKPTTSALTKECQRAIIQAIADGKVRDFHTAYHFIAQLIQRYKSHIKHEMLKSTSVVSWRARTPYPETLQQFVQIVERIINDEQKVDPVTGLTLDKLLHISVHILAMFTYNVYKNQAILKRGIRCTGLKVAWNPNVLRVVNSRIQKAFSKLTRNNRELAEFVVKFINKINKLKLVTVPSDRLNELQQLADTNLSQVIETQVVKPALIALPVILNENQINQLYKALKSHTVV